MTRDAIDRLRMFAGGVSVDRLALNWEQVLRYNPPPNPAKLSDSRAESYIEKFGDESWELDALNPTILSDLIETAVLKLRDNDLWDDAVNEEQEGISQLIEASNRWDEVANFLAE